MVEIRVDRAGVAAEHQPRQDQPYQADGLGAGEEILYDAAVLEAPGIGPGEQGDDRDGHQLRS